MNAMKNKIRSRRGASITFALLLFLVCAVVSSVVVVAGTTAAGRMSGLRDMDQRYQAVSDAGYQLCQIFDGASVTVEYNKEDKTVPTEPDGDAILVDASKAAVTTGTLSRETKPVSIGEDDAACDCVLLEELKDGLLTFIISAEGGKSTSGTYTLRLTFASNIKRSATDASLSTTTATVTWKLRDIHKIRAAAKT